MMKLVLYEGDEYRAKELASGLIEDTGESISEEDRKNIAESIFEALWKHPIAKGQISSKSDSDDLEEKDEDLDFSEQNGSSYLAKYAARGNKLILGFLVGSATFFLKDGRQVNIEILPKVRSQNKDDLDRESLRRMWSFATGLNLREDQSNAKMEMAKLPLHEWFINKFINQVEQLLERGIRAQYIETEENLMTVRGRLCVQENLRANAYAPHQFYCRFEEFSPNRPENRLIKQALLKIRSRSSKDTSRHKATHLADLMHEIPNSVDIDRDFSLWATDKLIKDYREIRSTCEWILKEQSPAPIVGRQSMFGRFVRMNDVFERYVARWMDNQSLQQGSSYRVLEQGNGNAISRVLCQGIDNASTYHTMRPDIQVYANNNKCIAILDSKWKKTRIDNKPAAREDLFQCHAYASEWLQGKDDCTKRFIGIIHPTADPQDRNTIVFQYKTLPTVIGASLKFLLPRKSEDGKNWIEGFQINSDSKRHLDQFTFLYSAIHN